MHLSNNTQGEQALQAQIAELERRLAESARQCEAIANELEAFGACLSHDLRAPLRSIEGFSRLLLQAQSAERLDPTGQDYLQRIHQASLRLGQMMADLLQLVRVARGGAGTGQVDLSGMAEEILSGLRSAAPARQAEVRVQAEIVVTGDARLLRLLLESLLGNAWKFTSKSAHAEIEFCRGVDDGAAALCIRDNGVGFDQKYADRLFRPFQRLHAESEFAGTGMGLATAQRIIHAHGGRIWAQAQRGAGACFFFTLPAAAALDNAA